MGAQDVSSQDCERFDEYTMLRGGGKLGEHLGSKRSLCRHPIPWMAHSLPSL